MKLVNIIKLYIKVLKNNKGVKTNNKLMADLPREPRIDIKKNQSSLEPFKQVRGFYDCEIDPLFRLLLEDPLSNSLMHSLRKYLVIIIFAALDYFFRNAVRKLIDDNDLNVVPLFPPNSQKKLDRLVRECATTKGNIVASTYRFVDIHELTLYFQTSYK